MKTPWIRANTTAISHELHFPWKSQESLSPLQEKVRGYMPVNMKYFLKLQERKDPTVSSLGLLTTAPGIVT